MSAIEVGRVCKKLTGRESGRYCVVLGPVDEKYISVTGPKTLTGVKRRNCNLLHLEPTDKKIDVKEGASDEQVKKALEKAGLTDMVKLNK